MNDSEIAQQLARYNAGEDRPPWTGAVVDYNKLAAETQAGVFASEFWWAGSVCDFCIYEAAGCQGDVYFCRAHEGLVI